jgi:hypothetical protein
VGSDDDILNFFFWENLRLPFFSQVDVRIQRPRSVHIENVNESTFAIVRSNGASPLFVFIQIEIQLGKNVRRFMTIRVPFGMDGKLYQSSAFPSIFRNVSAAASYLVATLSESQQFADNCAKSFPMANEMWARFVFAMLQSRIWLESGQERQGLLLAISNTIPQLLILQFMPLYVVNGKLSGSRGVEASACISHDGIFVVGDCDVKSICELLELNECLLPIYRVSEVPAIPYDESVFTAWHQQWEESRPYRTAGKL